MVCLYCGGKTAVINSRPQKRRNQTWRRRSCIRCGSVFTSIESYDLTQSIVVGSLGGRPVGFSRDKLFVSIYAALGHRYDPTSDAAALTETIITHLLSSEKTVLVQKSDIVLVASKVLGRFDQPAATYYAAYHKLAQA